MSREVPIKEREAAPIVAAEFSSTITREMIRELRQALGQNMVEFGWTLKRAVDPKAKRPYSRQYIHGLETGKGRYPITPELEAAFWNIATALDDVPAAIGGAVSVLVLAQPGQVSPGTLVKRSLKEKRCKRPGCAVVFIGPGKYHDEECRKAWAKEKRKLLKR